MLSFLKNAQLKYKFWLLNFVVLGVLCLLVLFSMNRLATATGRGFLDVFWETAPAFAGVVAALMVIEMFCSQLLITLIERHINRLKTTMLQVQQTGDLNNRADIDSRDEIGAMAAAFNSMLERTGTVIKSIKTAVEQLHVESEMITSHAQTRREDLKKQQTVAHHSTLAIEEMLQGFAGIAMQADTARSLSKAARDAATAGAEKVGRTTQSIGKLSNIIATATDNVGALADSSLEITRTVSEIRGIAEQTNLLALNAAIEAARAGDQGRGFAVVADEVRTLALRVQDSTEQIQRTMDSLLRAMNNSVNQMTESSTQVSLCVEEASIGLAALEHINQLIEQIARANEDIAKTSAEQTKSTDQVLNDVRIIRETTQNMANQLADTADMSRRLKKTIESLEDAASKVKF